ncbi:hemerythrin domain-containing protein [Adhaeretor mobilis]|uniref:Hemerythrin-like domain-containing protein n=1 Tax=Adhaeretor mobilis TaxID=1930276 RepID=A0A517MZB7_9BACT|nr:hemerythrin domain-containing protein [Adhaeretor mobilis]QDT00232.1 hypothetical protein HG15A2_35680 [Adhaeretor mobilis]
MAASDWDHELFKVVQQKNRELTDSLEAISRMVDTRSYEKRELEDLLSKLRDLLELHFEIEERGSYLAELVGSEPRYESQVEVLLAEHRALLEELEKLRLLVRSGVESTALSIRSEDDFHKFVSRLLNHEHVERQLLQRAFSDDIGTGD